MQIVFVSLNRDERTARKNYPDWPQCVWFPSTFGMTQSNEHTGSLLTRTDQDRGPESVSTHRHDSDTSSPNNTYKSFALLLMFSQYPVKPVQETSKSLSGVH